ncbi:MAG: TetR/AcrR family transcriptional regulator [Acetatifactor sp.]
MELKKTILEGTLEVFNQKGIKFTMDDIARTLNISKKTIYTVFDDKESLFIAMVDYLFDSIKESEEQVLKDESLDTLGKIRRILGVMPESYKTIDFRQLYLLREKYPAIYAKVEERLETGWENTIALLEQGMAEGVVRKVSIPIVKMMLEASLEQFFQRDILIRNDIGYFEALDEVVHVIVDGIAVKNGKGMEE